MSDSPTSSPTSGPPTSGPPTSGPSPVRSGRVEDLIVLARSAKGFMPDDEGLALLDAAARAAAANPAGATLMEIGAWCGKSTVYLGAAAEAGRAVLFSLDHHHGSEENQPGWDHHDHDVVDRTTGRIDTLPFWRRTIDGAGLGACVVGLVGDSPTIASRWRTPLDLCFIDGGHGQEPAWADFTGWAPHVAVGRWLAIHDVFPDPADGGRPPYKLWNAALTSGEFTEDGECGSLRILRRVAPPGVAARGAGR
jgi:MMP 1-O-methyltransferase